MTMKRATDRQSGSRPTLLIAIKGLGIGGAERLVSEGAKYWRRDLFDYHVAYALPWKSQLVADLTALDVPVHLVGGDRGLSPGTLGKFRETIRRLGANLVHAHLPTMGIVARLASPIPVVYTEHNLANSYRPLTRLANRLTYARNDAVIAVSGAVARSVDGYPGPPPSVIPNGVSCRVTEYEAFEARRELEIASEAALVVHVGNIRPHKGHGTLIRAAASIKAARPDVVMVSIGAEKNPGDLERVRREAAELGVGETIRFLGRRRDALRFVAAADVFLNPSDVEGLPLAVLEAMALGTPVVATSVGGVPSVVKDNETGLLVAPSEPESLARATLRLLADSEVAEKLAGAAREVVERAYSLEAMVLAQEAVYRAVLDD